MTTEQPQQTIPFSLKSAYECANILFEALPKSRKMEHIGTLNELLVPLGKAIRQLGETWTGEEKKE